MRLAAEAALVGEIEAGVWGCCVGLLFGVLQELAGMCTRASRSTTLGRM